MNKKFSTLVASILLASSIGTVNAATPEFVKFKDAGTVATSVKQGAAFQLANGDGQVLALVRTGEVYNYKYELKMVAAGSNANLAETLWKITYQENKEGGPSFTFVSAAYGIPLSFTPKNVDKNGIISEYPGTDGLWKWLPSLNVTGTNTFAPTALINNYSAKLDSAVVLATSAGKVVAKRYKTSAGVPTEALNLQPIVAASVVLGADDLNSMLMTQGADSKFKLTFNDDVKGSEIGNLWTKGMLKAEPAIANSTSMFAPAEDAIYYSEAEAAAAAAGYAAVADWDNADYAKELINGVENANVSAFITEVANAAEGDNFAAAVTAAQAKLDDQAATVAKATANQAVAVAMKAVVTEGNYGAAVSGSNNTAAYLQALLVDDNMSSTTEVKAALVAAAQAAITGDTYTSQGAIDAAKQQVVNFAAQFAEKQLPGIVDDKDVAAQADALAKLKALFADEEDALKVTFKAMTQDNGNTVDAINAALVTLAADAALLPDMAVTTDMKAPVDAFDKAAYVASLNSSIAPAAGYEQADIDAVAAALAEALNANTYLTALADCKTEAEKVLDAYAEVDGYKNVTAYTNVIAEIEDALNVTGAEVKAAVATAVDAASKDKDVIAEITALLNGNVVDEATLAVAVNAVKNAVITVDDVKEAGSEAGSEVIDAVKAQYVSLSLDKKDAKKHDLYLAVDTNFVTSASGRRNLTFAEWYYNMPKTSKGVDMPVAMQRDYNGHFNFKFTYYPTQDSLDIVTDGYAMLPAEGTKYWADIKDPKPTYSYEGNGKTVMLAVLANTHTEATVGEPQNVSGTDRTTINTRIGFNVNLAQGAEIAEGVYTIQYISNDVKNKNDNGRYLVANWLPEGQAIAKVEDQNLNHIPAAQWMLSHNNGSNINTILNRESGENLNYYTVSANTSYLPVQYLYATATKDLYTTVYGDSLKLSQITDKVALADSTLGYYAAAKYNEETADQLEVYALRYLNEIEGLFVNYTEKDSILNVTKAEDAEVYFRLIPTFAAVQYGASDKDIAKDLYRQAYYIQLETPNKNVKDEDKLYISRDVNGKYRLVTREYEKIDDKNVLTWSAVKPFLLKEFKEVDGTCNYALIEAKAILNDKEDAIIGYEPSNMKISVKDYPSILVTEKLEGEMQGWYGLYQDGRTSTFALIQKDAPKYRRLNVTDAEDGLKDMDVNNAEFYVTRNSNRFLYENTMNKVAGYEADPLGLNFLGDFNAKEMDSNAAMFVDTAYVRNNTNRPQYMLALRPDFTPVLQDCPYDPSHGKHEIPQVKASYLVTLADSVANAANKTEETKFTYENRKYTRLAFVDGIHRGDSLIILSSKFTGTKNAANDTIDLSKNAFVEGAWQFRLTGNEGAEFYIEGAKNNSFIRLINGVAVLTDDITDAERFNINKTDKTPVSNEGINAAEVSVIAGNGIVTIKGAAGKNVVITNVLGQTIANTVLSSDNATLSAPAGIVVVAVEGEAAVKAIVK